MSPRRRLARLVGLLVMWQAINVLERAVYAAGVEDGADEEQERRRELALRALEDAARRERERQADDELEPADCSDVVEAHAGCCGTPA